MRATAYCLVLGVGLTLLTNRAGEAQPAPATGPPLSHVEATWTAFWNHISLGDLQGAAQYVHSRRRDVLSTNPDLRKLQEIADQMAFCRIDPIPFQIQGDEVWYPVHCRRGTRPRRPSSACAATLTACGGSRSSDRS
jgi:hypothetical protein